jgi:hypothetical protein
MRYRALAICSLALAVAGCCGSHEESVALARGLSQERLAKLAADVEALGVNGRFDESEIPAQFLDLQPRSVRRRGSSVFFHLSGCADDKVYLVVRPGDEAHKGEVALLPGEAKERLVLWQAAAGAP